MAANSKVPVINSLSDMWHPCQLLADLLTIKEEFGQTQGLKLAYIGDAANNMGNSYLVASALAGMSVSVAGPEGFLPDPEVVSRARSIASEFGQTIEIHTDAALAVDGADVITTDTWVSMGMEAEKESRIKTFSEYTVTADLMNKANPNAIFLHCLPAYRGYEVAAEVIDGPQSRIWDEAENRLHAQKALMLWLSRQP
jgi:ornithine carbamoyltransferase